MTVRRVTDIQNYSKVLAEVRDAGRTPLVVSSLQNPIETMDLVVSMGWEMNAMRNVNLRTVARMNTHALGWLREQRANLRTSYENCLEQMQPWIMNLLLDEDENPEDPWPHMYDPDLDFLFGKVGPGLPETVWEGHKIFKSMELLPECVKARIEENYQMEVQRRQSELEESKEKAKALSPRSKVSDTNQQEFDMQKSPSEVELNEKTHMEETLKEM